MKRGEQGFKGVRRSIRSGYFRAYYIRKGKIFHVTKPHRDFQTAELAARASDNARVAASPSAILYAFHDLNFPEEYQERYSVALEKRVSRLEHEAMIGDKALRSVPLPDSANADVLADRLNAVDPATTASRYGVHRETVISRQDVLLQGLAKAHSNPVDDNEVAESGALTKVMSWFGGKETKSDDDE